MTAKENCVGRSRPCSETEAKDALDYIVRRRERDPVVELLYSAPEDDEPTTPEDEKGVRDAKAEIERGETLSAEEIRRELT
jgi:hypothetical protein